jgi:hypothetical protein
MAEEGGDGLQAHAAVDRLGGQSMPELMRMDVRQPGCGACPVDHPGDGVPVQRPAVLAGQQERIIRPDVGGAVAVDEGDQLGVQRQVAVLAELADRDVQPGPGAYEDDCIGLQAGELADPQASTQQHLDGDPHQHPAVLLGGAQQLGGGGVVEGPGQGMVLAGQVTGEHRHPRRGLVPAPFLDAEEEHPQGAEAVRDRGGGQPRSVLAGAGGQPGLEVLNVAAGDAGKRRGQRGRLGQECGERAQRQIRAADAARPQYAGDLLQVAAHRDGDCRDCRF